MLFSDVRRMLAPVSPIRVIIYGLHSADWMEALAPEAPVWLDIPNVVEVAVAPDAEAVAAIPSRTGVRDVIIPLMEGHLLSCPPGYWGLRPTARAVKILADKQRFAAHVREQRQERLVPRSYASAAEATYPCVLKRTDLNGGVGVAVAHSAVELDEMLAREPWKGRAFVLQALVPGDREYVTHAVCRNGRIIWHCSYEYTMPPGASARTPRNVVSRAPYLATRRDLRAIERLVRPLRYDGPLNVDHKKNADGEICIFEINPRLGGSLMIPEYVGDLRGALLAIMQAARQPGRATVAGTGELFAAAA